MLLEVIIGKPFNCNGYNCKMRAGVLAIVSGFSQFLTYMYTGNKSFEVTFR